MGLANSPGSKYWCSIGFRASLGNSNRLGVATLGITSGRTTSRVSHAWGVEDPGLGLGLSDTLGLVELAYS